MPVAMFLGLLALIATPTGCALGVTAFAALFPHAAHDGTLSAVPSANKNEAAYVLPYPVGVSYPLLQGYHGKWGHEGAAAYAYDFQLPLGSLVTAARGGTVVKIETSHRDGTRKPGEENFVFVSHGDGTFSRYYHLAQGGVLVAAGDRVLPGQEIGRSGDSGASAGPHLHFDVTKECAEWGCQTVPISFTNTTENPLLPERVYQAQPR